MTGKLTKADKAVLRRAIDLAARHWHSESLNYHTIASHRDGAWPISPAQADRKYRAYKRHREALLKAAEKLGI